MKGTSYPLYRDASHDFTVSPTTAADDSADGGNKLRWIDWIWHVRGSVELAPGQSSGQAFDRLEPLFQETGTTYERKDDVLCFQKKDAASQDKMSVFSDGVLRIEQGAQGRVLRYNLTSRALLWCLLAPLLFLAISQVSVVIGMRQKAAAEAAAKSGKKPEEKKKAEVPMNPIDKFLGAPAAEKPDKKKKDQAEGRKKGPTPTPGYVFAGIFAVLYLVGRVLEDRLVRSLFRKRLLNL